MSAARMSGAEPIRLGRIGYLNVLPIYHPIESGEVDCGCPLTVVAGPPAELNRRMSAGELDASSCSSIEYARNAGDYLLVPDLAIGSRGPVQSVLLMSRVPVEDLGGRELLVSAQTHTSAALLRMLLDEYVQVRPRFTVGGITDALARGETPDAFLAIGDEALRLREHPAYPVRWDLGQAWMDWTGLPFIFGVWVVSRRSVRRLGARLDAVAAALAEGKRLGASRLPLYAGMAAAGGMLDEPRMLSYFRGLVYDFGAREQEGVRRFFERLAERGEIPAPPALEFLTRERAAAALG